MADSTGDQAVAIAQRLSEAVRGLTFAEPVAHVYRPLDYAHRAHEAYLHRYARAGIEALLVGMNPGPWGMVQTGVPFGEIAAVRDFLGIEAPVDRPPDEHPKRPVQGFDCTRSEVSGRRFWGWVQERFGQADPFFDRFFVLNWCPLAFLEASGRNRTPDRLPARERRALYAACDDALRAVVDLLRPNLVIGVGVFPQKRAMEALAGTGVRIERILHPSPASPAANRGWVPAVERQLDEMGIQMETPAMP